MTEVILLIAFTALWQSIGVVESNFRRLPGKTLKTLRSLDPPDLEPASRVQDDEALGVWSDSSSVSSSSLSSALTSSGDVNSDDVYDSDDPNGQEAFSLRHAVYTDFSQSQSLCCSQGVPSDENIIIKSLNREKVTTLANHLGLPPGLKPCLELEVARLQLAVAIFRHKSIGCDRGCEGEDDEDDDDSLTSTDEDTAADEDGDWDEDSLSEPSLTLSEDGDVDTEDSSESTEESDHPSPDPLNLSATNGEPFVAVSCHSTSSESLSVCDGEGEEGVNR